MSPVCIFLQLVFLVSWKYPTQDSVVLSLCLNAHCYGDSSRRECCQGSFRRFLCLRCNYFYYLERRWQLSFAPCLVLCYELDFFCCLLDIQTSFYSDVQAYFCGFVQTVNAIKYRCRGTQTRSSPCCSRHMLFFFFFSSHNTPPSNFLKIKIKNHTQSQGSATWLALSPLPHSWREAIFTVAMAALILSHIWSFLSALLHDSVHRLPLSMSWASGGETIASARTRLLAKSSQPSVHPQAVLGLLRCSYVVLGQLFWMYWTQFVRFFIFFFSSLHCFRRLAH